MTNHFLAQSGFQCSDPRVTRLVSLAAHKYALLLSTGAFWTLFLSAQLSWRRVDDLLLRVPPRPPRRAACHPPSHRFIADITDDALERCKQRQQPKAAAAAAQGGKSGKSEMRLVLTTEDLSASCKEYGIHIKRPPYFADKPSK